MTSFKKNVTDAEIEAMMKPHLDALMKKVVTHSDNSRAKDEAQEIPNPEVDKRHESKSIQITSEEKEYLESIFEKPNFSITQRARELGLSSYINDKMKKTLLKKNLISEFSLNLGHATRGVVKLLELTSAGYKAIGKEIPDLNKRNCSSEHWFWQVNIKNYYSSLGIRAEIEFLMNGKHADVGIFQDGKTIAIEVELTPRNSIVNAKQNVKAGFDEIILALKNAQVKKAIEAHIQKHLSEDELKKVKVMLLSEFPFVKDILG